MRSGRERAYQEPAGGFVVGIVVVVGAEDDENFRGHFEGIVILLIECQLRGMKVCYFVRKGIVFKGSMAGFHHNTKQAKLWWG